MENKILMPWFAALRFPQEASTVATCPPAGRMPVEARQEPRRAAPDFDLTDVLPGFAFAGGAIPPGQIFVP